MDSLPQLELHSYSPGRVVSMLASVGGVFLGSTGTWLPAALLPMFLGCRERQAPNSTPLSLLLRGDVGIVAEMPAGRVARKETGSLGALSSEHYGLTVEGNSSLPLFRKQQGLRVAEYGASRLTAHVRSTISAKTTLRLHDSSTHGNEKTFSLLFNHQSVSGFRIHLREII